MRYCPLHIRFSPPNCPSRSAVNPRPHPLRRVCPSKTFPNLMFARRRKFFWSSAISKAALTFVSRFSEVLCNTVAHVASCTLPCCRFPDIVGWRFNILLWPNLRDLLPPRVHHSYENVSDSVATSTPPEIVLGVPPFLLAQRRRIGAPIPHRLRLPPRSWSR